MLKLETDYCGRCGFSTFSMENRMASCNHCLSPCFASIKWNRINEAFFAYKMLIYCPFIPHLIDGFIIVFAKCFPNRIKELNKCLVNFFYFHIIIKYSITIPRSKFLGHIGMKLLPSCKTAMSGEKSHRYAETLLKFVSKLENFEILIIFGKRNRNFLLMIDYNKHDWLLVYKFLKILPGQQTH